MSGGIAKTNFEVHLPRISSESGRRQAIIQGALNGRTTDPTHVVTALDALEAARRFDDAAGLAERTGDIPRALRNLQDGNKFMAAADLAERTGDSELRDAYYRMEIENVYSRSLSFGAVGRISDETMELAVRLGDQSLITMLERAPIQGLLNDEKPDYYGALEFAKRLGDKEAEHDMRIALIEHLLANDYKRVILEAEYLPNKEEQQRYLLLAFERALWQEDDVEVLKKVAAKIYDRSQVLTTSGKVIVEVEHLGAFNLSAKIHTFLGNRDAAKAFNEKQIEKLILGARLIEAATLAEKLGMFDTSNRLYKEVIDKFVDHALQIIEHGQHESLPTHTISSLIDHIRDEQMVRDAREKLVDIYERSGQFKKAADLLVHMREHERAKIYRDIANAIRPE